MPNGCVYWRMTWRMTSPASPGADRETFRAPRDGTGMATNAQSAVGPGNMAAWWPSRYGANDEAGALNEISPAKVLEAVGLVRSAPSGR